MIKYNNGNCVVELFDDGTKIRTCEGIPRPVHPECIDVKITDYCDAKCAYCHEKSTVEGKHCDVNSLLSSVSELPCGVELAIGGGNPLSHPDIERILLSLKERGFIANLTVNQLHVRRQHDLILKLLDDKLINGLGVSYSSKSYLDDIVDVIKKTKNVVVHMIAGVNSVDDFYDVHGACQGIDAQTKVLVLGYKQFGFGIKYYDASVEQQIYEWYVSIGKVIRAQNSIVSFDNLAIEQLKLKRFFKESDWNELYMGDDFQFTMYIDAIKQQYAKSSTSPNRTNFSEMSLIDFFQSDKQSA